MILYIYLAGVAVVTAFVTFVEVAAAVAGKRDFDRISDMLIITSWPIVLFLMTMELVCGLPASFINVKRETYNALENLRFVRRSP